MVEVRACLGDTLLSCTAVGSEEARWPSSLARAGAGIVGLGGLLLILLAEPALGGLALLIAAALLVLGRRADPAATVLPFAVRRGAASFELCWPASLEGELEEPSGKIALASLRDSGRARIVGAGCVLPIGGTPLRVESGALRLEIEEIARSEGLPKTRGRDPERRALLGFALGSVVLHGSVVALALSLPLPLPVGILGPASRRTPRRLAMVAMPETGRSGGGPLQLWLSNGGEAGGTAPRIASVAAPPRGARPFDPRGLYLLRGPRDGMDPHVARRIAESAARTAGVLGVLRDRGDGEGSELANTWGNALPSLTGNPIGEAYGVGGLGLVGTGRGGGGTGTGTVLSGAFGTFGRGGGEGGGASYGMGVGGLASFSSNSCAGADEDCSSVISGRAEVRGGFDKEIIRRHVRRHINEVRYCYQKELQAHPYAPDGRVAVRFEIGPDGRVISSRLVSSTLGIPVIERCVASAPLRWLFPKPRGGGVAEVTYPFYFRVAGGR